MANDPSPNDLPFLQSRFPFRKSILGNNTSISSSSDDSGHGDAGLNSNGKERDLDEEWYDALDVETSRESKSNYPDNNITVNDEYWEIQPETIDRALETYHDDSDLVRADTQDSLAVVRTISKVPGNNTYYEKGGLRTYGDGQDHLTEPSMTWRRFMIFVAMGFLWTASQIPLYLFGGLVVVIQAELGGGPIYVWILLAYIIPLASITPFVGPLADLIGRRNISLLGSFFLVLGSILCATAGSMNVFIGGQAFNGIGAGILELIALAVAGESAPTAKRGLYIGGIIITIFPYCPSVLYAQLVSASASWRYIGLWTGLWSFTGGVLTALFYWPPRRANRRGLTKIQILKRIDFTGGILISAGLTLFIMGLTWGGDQYAWTSNHVLPCLVIGSVFIVTYAIWEMFFVKYPMFPRRLGINPRALTTVLIITFASGANFFSVLVFWPTQYQTVYTSPSPLVDDPVQVGLGSLPVGFCIIGGSIIFSLLISLFKGHIKWLMVFSTLIMTVGSGCLSLATIDNLGAGYAALSIACLGVGATIIPNQIIAGIICPDDLIGSITALTISVRFVGGAIAYAAYYHVIRRNFLTHLNPIAGAIIDAGIISPELAIDIVYDLSYNQHKALLQYPILANNVSAATEIIRQGQIAFSLSYPECYLVSIAFGATSVVAALLLPNIEKFMDNHIAVQYLQTPNKMSEAAKPAGEVSGYSAS